MHAFRKLAYMLLSRHFYVGFAIGWFCASLFVFANVSNAQVPIQNYQTYVYGDQTRPFTFGSSPVNTVFLNSIIATSTISSKLQYTVNCTNCNAYSGYGASSTVSHKGGSTTLEIAYNAYVTTGTCDLHRGNYVSQGWQINSSPIHALTTGASTTIYTWASTTAQGVAYAISGGATSAQHNCQIDVHSIKINGVETLQIFEPTSGGGATTTLFYPIGLNAIIDDMNCVNTSTGTDCVFQYATSTPLTAQDFLAYFLIFTIIFVLSFYFTKKLLYHVD